MLFTWCDDSCATPLWQGALLELRGGGDIQGVGCTTSGSNCSLNARIEGLEAAVAKLSKENEILRHRPNGTLSIGDNIESTCSSDGAMRFIPTFKVLQICSDGEWVDVGGDGGFPRSPPPAPLAPPSSPPPSYPPPPSAPIKFNAAGKNTCADHKNNLDPGAAGYMVVFDYHDDRSTDDIPNKKEDIAKGFTTGNAMYIGNNALNALSFSEAEFCMAKARSSPDTECKEWKVTADVTSVPSDVGEGYSSCYVFGDSDFTYTPKTSHDTLGGLVGKTRKLIGAFGGQVARPHPSAPCPLYLPSCAPRCLLLCEPGRTQPQPHSGRALLL